VRYCHVFSRGAYGFNSVATWKIDNPDEVKAHEGHHVSVDANEDVATDTLHVNSVKVLGKGKGATNSNTNSGTKY